jgi:hypothetical protein
MCFSSRSALGLPLAPDHLLEARALLMVPSDLQKRNGNSISNRHPSFAGVLHPAIMRHGTADLPGHQLSLLLGCRSVCALLRGLAHRAPGSIGCDVSPDCLGTLGKTPPRLDTHGSARHRACWNMGHCDRPSGNFARRRIADPPTSPLGSRSGNHYALLPVSSESQSGTSAPDDRSKAGPADATTSALATGLYCYADCICMASMSDAAIMR